MEVESKHVANLMKAVIFLTAHKEDLSMKVESKQAANHMKAVIFLTAHKEDFLEWR